MFSTKLFIPWIYVITFWAVIVGTMLSCFASEKDAVTLEKITITATKQESNANDFSGSISVTNDTFIEEHQINTTKELTRFIPNLFYKTSTSGDAFVARGISTIDTSLFSPMSLYVDDVASPLSYMLDTPLFDIERVEVIRGPQSTLYGKNSESGVINVIMAQPGNEIKSRVLLEAGNYSTYSEGISLSGPAIKDKLFMGLTIFNHNSDGYMENLLNNKDNVSDNQILYAKGTLRWTPRSDLDISLSLDATDKELGINNLRFENGPYVTGRYEVNNNGPDEADQKNLGQALRVMYQFNGLKLTSITSHRSFDRNFKKDFDCAYTDLGFSEIDLDEDNWTQEFRLASSKDSPFLWLLGLYANHENLDVSWALNHISPAMANSRESDSEFDDIALFGQSTLKLTDRLNLTGGVRLEHVSASGNQVYTSQSGTDTFDKDLSDTEILPMASLNYSLTENINTYITFSTGWMAGGYDYYTAATQDAFTYDPEYTKNYEAGFKTSFLNKRVSANIALFYTQIDDKQVKEEAPGGGVTVWKYTNAAKAHTIGCELEVKALPFNSLELFASIGYAKSEIDDWIAQTSSGESIDYNGNTLPWAPDLTGNVGVGYYMDNGFYCIADVFLAGKQYFDALNTLEDDGYALVNLKTGFQYKKYNISVWGKNLFDQAYANKKVKNSMGYTMIEDGAPMTFGITLNWRF